MARYAYLVGVTHAVTVAPTVLNEIISHIKEQTDLTVLPEMLWIPVATFALIHSGINIWKRVDFETRSPERAIAERRRARKAGLKRGATKPKNNLVPQKDIPPFLRNRRS